MEYRDLPALAANLPIDAESRPECYIQFPIGLEVRPKLEPQEVEDLTHQKNYEVLIQTYKGLAAEGPRLEFLHKHSPPTSDIANTVDNKWRGWTELLKKAIHHARTRDAVSIWMYLPHSLPTYKGRNMKDLRGENISEKLKSYLENIFEGQ